MQNKPNFKMGKMTISTASLKAYTNKQRTMNSEHYSKQTQSNPIPPPKSRPALKKVVQNLKDRLLAWYNPENNPYRPAQTVVHKGRFGRSSRELKTAKGVSNYGTTF